MNIDLPWKEDALSLSLPEAWHVLLPGRLDLSGGRAPDERAIVRAALDNPVGEQKIADKNLSGKKILVIVDDNTRPTPAHRFFDLLLEDLEAAGAAMENVTALTALGIHTPMTESEMAEKIGARMMIVNVLLDEKQRITAAYAGDPVKAHREGMAYNRKKAGIPMEEAVDGIIVNSQPMNINFKQSMKCIANALPALKPGGVIMAFLQAERGLDDIPLPDGGATFQVI